MKTKQSLSEELTGSLNHTERRKLTRISDTAMVDLSLVAIVEKPKEDNVLITLRQVDGDESIQEVRYGYQKEVLDALGWEEPKKR